MVTSCKVFSDISANVLNNNLVNIKYFLFVFVVIHTEYMGLNIWVIYQ